MLTTLQSLEPGATYAIQFAGVDDSGNVTDWSQTYTITAPAETSHPAPTNLQFAYSTGNISASWSPPATIREDFDGYVVEVLSPADVVLGVYFVKQTIAQAALGSNFNFTLALNDSLSAIPIPNPKFKIYSLDKGGNLSASPLTGQAGYTGIGTPGAVAPSPVVNGVNWKWSAPPAGSNGETAIVDYYQVDVDLSGSTSWFIDANDIEGTVYGLNYLYIGSPGTNYAAQVRAVDVFGRFGPALSMSATSLTDATGGATDSTPPTLTGSITASAGATTADGQSEFSTSWPAGTDAESGIAGYYVKIMRSGDTVWTTVFVDGTTHMFRGLTPGTQYLVNVLAVNNAGLSSTPAIALSPSPFTTPAVPVPANVSSIAAAWTTPNLVLTITDSRSASTPIFSHFEIDVTANATTKTFRVNPEATKSLTITPDMWMTNFGSSTAPSIAHTAISAYAVNTAGVRSAAATNPTAGTYTFTARSAPTGVQLALTPGTISATWTRPATYTGIVRYDVLAIEDTVALNAATPTATATGTGHIDSVTTYKASFGWSLSASDRLVRVAVQATDVFGRTTTSSVVSTGAVTAPTLNAIAPGPATVGGSCSAVAGAVEYIHYADLGTPNPPTTIVSRSASTKAIWDAGATAGTWIYSAVAVNALGTASSKPTAVTALSTAWNMAKPAQVTNPTSPGSLSTTLTRNGTFKISGTITYSGSSASNFSHYLIRYSTTNGTWSNSFSSFSPTFEITNLPRSGSIYYVSVLAVTTAGIMSDPATSGSITAPTSNVPAPGTVTISSWSTPDLTVSWAAATQALAGDVVSYQIEFTNNAGTSWKTFRTTDLSFTLTAQQNIAMFGGTPVTSVGGATNIVQVRSVSDTDAVSSPSVYAGTISNTWPLVQAAPTLAVGPGWIDVSWSNVDGAMSYELYQGATATPTTAVYSGTVTSTRVTTSGTTLQYFRLRAKNVLGVFSSYGTAQSATPALTYLQDTVAPAQAAQPTLSSGGCELGISSVVVTWAKNTESDLAGYRIRFSKDGTNWQYQDTGKISQKTGASESVTVGGLLPGVMYTFAVAAYDLAGNLGSYSTSASFTSPANTTPPETPGSPTATGSATGVIVSCSTPTDPDVIGWDVFASNTSGFTAGSSNKVGFLQRGTTNIERFDLPSQAVSLSSISALAFGERTATLVSGTTHAFEVGQTVSISGVDPSGVNEASRTITAINAGRTTFTYSSVSATTYVGGGQASLASTWYVRVKAVNTSNISSLQSNATSVTPGLIDGAAFADATIISAKIKDLTADKIKSGVIAAETITVGTDSGDAVKIDGLNKQLRSGNYTSGATGPGSGWIIDGDGNAEFNSVDIRTNFEIGPATGNRVKMDQTGLAVVEVVAGQNVTAFSVDTEGLHGYDNADVGGSVVTTKTFDVNRETGRVTAGGASLRTRVSEKISVTDREFDPVKRTSKLTLGKRHGIKVGDSVRVTDLWDETITGVDLVAVGTGLVQMRLSNPAKYTYSNGCNVRTSVGIPQVDASDWSIYGHGQLRSDISSYYSTQSSWTAAGAIISMTPLGSNAGDEVEVKMNASHGLDLGQPFVISGMTAGGAPAYPIANFTSPVHVVSSIPSHKVFRFKRTTTGNLPTNAAAAGILKYNYWRINFGDPHPFKPAAGEWAGTGEAIGLQGLYYRESTLGGTVADTFNSLQETAMVGPLASSSWAGDTGLRFSINPASTIVAQSARFASTGYAYAPSTGYNARFLSILTDVESLYTLRPTSPSSLSVNASFSNGTFRVVEVGDTTVTVRNDNLPEAYSITSISDLSTGRRTVTVPLGTSYTKCMPGQTIIISGTSGLDETAVIYSTGVNTITYTSAIGAGVTGGAQGYLYVAPGPILTGILGANVELVTPGVVIEEKVGSAYIAIPSGSEDTSESPAIISGVKTSRRKKFTISAASRTSGSSSVSVTTLEPHGLSTGNYVEIRASGIGSGSINTVNYEPVPIVVADANTFSCTPNSQTSAIGFAGPTNVTDTVEKVIPIYRARTASISGNNYRRIANYYVTTTTGTATNDYDAGTEPVTQAFYTNVDHGLKNGDRIEILEKSQLFNYTFPRVRVKSPREFWVIGGEGSPYGSDYRPRRWYLPEKEHPVPTVGTVFSYASNGGITVSGISNGGTLRTVTLSAPANTSSTKLYPGMALYITGATDTNFNTRIVVSKVLSDTQFQYDAGYSGTYTGGAVLNRYVIEFDIGKDTAQTEFTAGRMVAIQTYPDTYTQYAMVRGTRTITVDPTDTTAPVLGPATKMVIQVDSRYSTVGAYPNYLSGEKFTLVIVPASISGWDSSTTSTYSDANGVTSLPPCGMAYVYEQERPQIEITSPTSIAEKIPASIKMEPGTVRRIANQSGGDILTNRAGMVTENDAALGGDIPDASEATIASTSRIVLTAGEVVLAGNYGQVVQVNLHTGWAVYEGGWGGVNVHQEIDGWWAMTGLITRSTSTALDAASESEIGAIESKFAWPKNTQILLVPAYISGKAHFAHLRVRSDGKISLTMPGFVPLDALGNVASAISKRDKWMYNGGNGGANGDWVSLSGVRWRV